MAANPTQALRKSYFSIPKMDGPSEEALIRMALASKEEIESLSFDLAHRKLEMVHHGDTVDIPGRLEPLNLGATL